MQVKGLLSRPKFDGKEQASYFLRCWLAPAKIKCGLNQNSFSPPPVDASAVHCFMPIFKETADVWKKARRLRGIPFVDISEFSLDYGLLS